MIRRLILNAATGLALQAAPAAAQTFTLRELGLQDAGSCRQLAARERTTCATLVLGCLDTATQAWRLFGDVSGMNVTANGRTQTLGAFLQAFPGAGANVAGVGLPGLDNPPGYFVYQHPSQFAIPPALRVQRDVPRSGGLPGNTYKAIWGVINTGPDETGYEWGITGEVFNRTLGTTGAQHVGVNGTIHKTAGPAEGQIGPSWGGNFSCLDQSGIKDPKYSCIGAEVNSGTTATGTDENRQRVGLQVAVGSQAPSTGAHFGYGILVGAYPNDIIDHGIALRTKLRIGLDTSAATFTGPAVALGATHRIAFDAADKDGSYSRTLRYQDGMLLYGTQHGDVVKITDEGQISAPSLVAAVPGNGVLTGFFVRAADPTPSDIPVGKCADWNNSRTETFKHVCNVAGRLRSASME